MAPSLPSRPLPRSSSIRPSVHTSEIDLKLVDSRRRLSASPLSQRKQHTRRVMVVSPCYANAKCSKSWCSFPMTHNFFRYKISAMQSSISNPAVAVPSQHRLPAKTFGHPFRSEFAMLQVRIAFQPDLLCPSLYDTHYKTAECY